MTFPIKYADLPHIVSPKGPAIWPKLNAPDYKFKTEFGEYSVKVRLNGASAQALIEQIEEFFPVALAHELIIQREKAERDGKKVPSKLKIAEFSRPYAAALDDDDEEIPGAFVFRFKRTAAGVYRSGPKKGKTWTGSVKLWDSHGNRFDKSVEIWSGSVVRCAAAIKPWFTNLGFGVRLDLNEVRVVELKTGGSGGQSDTDWGGDDEGYTAPPPSLGGDDEPGDGSGDFDDVPF